MINERLHRKVAALDRVRHRDLRLDIGRRDVGPMRGLNAFFVAAVEFGDACREYPVVWVAAGNDEKGVAQVAPMAVLGIGGDDNLCLDAEGRWRTRYVPAMLRMYPFAMARVDAERLAVCVDESWPGFGRERGERLFGDDGEPSAFTRGVQQQLEQFEMDVERTRAAGQALLAKGLLREMRFDASMADGRKLSLDGFLAIDQDKLAALSDADIVALQRNGLLSLIHAHLLSLGNMGRLAEWRTEREASASGAGGTAAVSAAAPAPPAS